ncbi:helix-turn-helix domain-containing protein [Streptomyces sp. NPDC014846]|uniref:helix-turn-helix domain-containing protein n=1 Tax=Streptomyces sp. NPDC014846 TaxID=3364922 RepID=UPI0036FAC5A8
MTATPARDKVSAVLWLAAGKSQRAAAEAAGVSPGTVAQWRRDPVFAAEVERIRRAWEEQPQDGRELLAQLDEVEARLTPAASTRRVEKQLARAVARGLRTVREADR